MFKTISKLLLFFLLILLTAGNYADAELKANPQLNQTDTITEIISTYLGESGNDSGYGIAVDKDGYIYVAGETGFGECFIVKLSPDCSKVEYYSSFEISYGLAVAVDASGRAYVVGGTFSSCLPVTPNALYPDYNYSGNREGFLIILSPDGAIEYCTYLGGEGGDYATGIAVDKNGNIYVTGYTSSYYFPVFNALYPEYSGHGDAFVIKFFPGGTAIYYSTFLGGSGMDKAQGIAADEKGNAYVTGWTHSSDFPVTLGAYDTINEGIHEGEGGYEVFVTKINPTGTAFPYSTFLGGICIDIGRGIAVDENGNACVTGETRGYFPTTYDTEHSEDCADTDAFIAMINSTGTELLWSRCLEGNDDDWAFAIGRDANGNIVVVGYTYSSDIPITFGAYGYSGGLEIFIAIFDSDGRMIFFSYFGGTKDETAEAVAVTEAGDVCFTGWTESSEYDGFLITPGVVDETHNGGRDPFVTIFLLSRLAMLTISSTSGGTTNPEPGTYACEKGTWIQIETIPDAGYTFSHWTGDVPSGYENTNPLTIVMDLDKSVTANFKAQTPPDKPDEPDGCFIATAVYGSPLHPHIDILRDFRDKYLMPNKFGQKLVSLYYHYSPSIADFIAKHRILKIAIQINLLPLIVFSYLTVHLSLTIPALSLILILVFLALSTHFRKILPKYRTFVYQ